MTTTYAHSAAPTAGPGAASPVRPVDAVSSVHGGQQVPASAGSHSAALRVDLCGLDYYLRRQRLFAALRALLPGQVLRVLSDRGEDVYWLRYEAEGRMRQRYRWSLPSVLPDAAETLVRLP